MPLSRRPVSMPHGRRRRGYGGADDGRDHGGPARGAHPRAIWLTPLLHRPEVVAALGRASAPFLLVGGTADAAWDGAVARRLTPHVLEVPDADHGLLLPGPLARSAEVLGRVCTAVEEFVRLTGPA